MIKKIKKFLEEHNLFKKVAKNSGILVFQNIFTMLLGVFITGVVARYFGTEKYGIFNYVLSIVGLFSGIAAIGTNHIVIKDLTQQPENEGKIMGTSFWLRVIISITLVILSEITVIVLSGGEKLYAIIGICLSSMMLFNCTEVIDLYATSIMRVKYIAISKIITFSILSILKIIVVWLNLSLEYYALMYLIESIIYAFLLVISYKIMHRKNKICKWYFDKEYAKKLLSKCWYFALSSIMVTIYLKIDQVMLGSMIKDKSQVGIYSAAVRIAEMWVFVPNAIISSFKPIIIAYKGKNEEEAYVKNLQRLYDILSIVSFIFAIGITIFSRIIIYILYGKEFLEAAKILYITIWGIWFGVLGNAHYVWMVCENKEKYSLFYSFSGSFVNIILNALLIPKYGMYGAAVATLCSQIASNILSFTIFKDTRILFKYITKAILFIEPIKLLKNKFIGEKYVEG